MATVTTISVNDFSRVKTAISLAIADAIHEREDKDSKTNNESGRANIADKTAKRVLSTLGLKVVDQSIFETL